MTIGRTLLAGALVTVSALAVMPRQPSPAASLDTLARTALARIDGTIDVPQLRADVRVVRDEWGIPHISAASADDLFFAHGYVVAQDRLWQMEMWRRTTEGRLAEIAGAGAIPHDRMARLLKYRGPVNDAELAVYHPDARGLMTAFVAGINTFIDQHKDRLPVEFVLTGVRPEPWTIDTLVLRQNTFGDAIDDLQLARMVGTLGLATANQISNPDPWDDLKVPEGLNVSSITDAVIASTRVRSAAPRPPLLPAFQAIAGNRPDPPAASAYSVDPGSNNWVVNGARSLTGKPVVVNDPHREVTLPSLRYIVHLQAPGWNVIGATEPPFLSIAAGHNERIGWGLTIVGTDQQDVYVEELNPANANEVRRGKGWEPLKIVEETIAVKGEAPQRVQIEFSRHGPIFFKDIANRRAYALETALHEPGTAPYLAGLRLSQVKDCRQFLDEARHWNAPSENLICGDVDGNISWRASALTPARKGWNGRLPVPGNGAFEWTGFRDDLPQSLNPASGLIVTANQNIQPKGYSPPLMFKNADTRYERITRLQQLFADDRKLSLDDHQRFQHDAHSLRAAADRRAFEGWTSSDAGVERSRAMLAAWDATYRADSAAAAIYETWLDVARAEAVQRLQPRMDRSDVERALRGAVARLTTTQGSDWTRWRWGRMHARAFPHQLARAFDLPAVERPGGAGTVAADGATFREILDTADWDRSLATNAPGQSGQPGSPFYGNLLPLWAENRYFPLVFSPQAIDRHASHRLVLKAGPGR